MKSHFSPLFSPLNEKINRIAQSSIEMPLTVDHLRTSQIRCATCNAWRATRDNVVEPRATQLMQTQRNVVYRNMSPHRQHTHIHHTTDSSRISISLLCFVPSFNCTAIVAAPVRLWITGLSYIQLHVRMILPQHDGKWYTRAVQSS